MSHDARVLLGRECIVPEDVRKEKCRVVATSDASGTIYAYLMSERGRLRRVSLAKLRFLKVYDYETQELVDAKK